MSENDPNGSHIPESGGDNKKKLAKKEFVEEYRLIPVEESNFSDDEEYIDVIGLLKDIWLNRKTVYIVTIIVLIFGFILFIGSERIYFSEAKLMPETTSSTSQLGQVFQQYENILGIQRRTDEEDIRISMYPDIVESLLFQIELMQHEVYFSDIGQRVTIFEYFSEHYEQSFIDQTKNVLWNFTFGLPSTLRNFFRGLFSDGEPERAIPDFSELRNFEEPVLLNSEIRRVVTILTRYITVSRDPQSGFISIGVALPDAYAATEMVIIVKNLLQEYVTDYRTEKALNDLEFIKQRHDEAKVNFQVAQDSLAAFRDRNVNIQRETVKVQQERLQTEFDLAFTLYSTLARRLQEAEIQVQKETPIFRVHEPATIPSRPAQPRAARVFGGALFVGLFLGVMLIFIKRGFAWFMNEFKNKELKNYPA